MPGSESSETRFAFEGPLPLWLIALLGLGLLALSWWTSRRDTRFAERPRWVWSFFGFRCIAVLVLLWALAGPTLITTVRKFKPKTVAILVDHSASMGLVDGVDGSGDSSRWAAARSDDRELRPLRQLDEAVSTLRAAVNRLERFSRLPDDTPKPAEARTEFDHAIHGIRMGASSIKACIGELPAAAIELRRGLIEAQAGLADEGLDMLQAKSAEFNRGKTLAALDRERWLPERLTLLAGSCAQLERLSDQFSESFEGPLAKDADALAHRESRLTRLDKVDAFMIEAEQSWLKDIRQKATVNRYEFGDAIVPLGSDGWKKVEGEARPPATLSATTQLGAALQQVALDGTAQPIEAAILVTDGGQNAGRDPRELANSLTGASLHIVPIGNIRMQRDVILHHTHGPKMALQNDRVVVDSAVTAYDCRNETLNLELLDNQIVVDRKTLKVSGDVFDNHFQLTWKAGTLGRHALVLRVVPVTGERTESNNSMQVDLNVMEDRIRILIADDYPRWETRYLVNLFHRDERVSFDQLLFEPERTLGDGVLAELPDSVAEWSKYRVVILGDLLPSQLSPAIQKNLVQYVTEAGGNLVLIAGKDAMPQAYLDQPLGSLLPVEPGDRAAAGNQPYYLHVTDEGSTTLATQVADTPEASERIWREMSERLPLYALSACSKPKPTAHSLIGASLSKTTLNPGDERTRTFLSWQYVGGGRVVFVSAPVTYQLRYRQGDAFHHRFWGQLVRWAVARDLGEGSRTVRLATDKSRYEQGDPVQVSVRLSQLDGKSVSGAVIQVAALQDGKLIQEMRIKEEPSRPGNYRVTLEQLPKGPVKLQVTGDRVKALLASEGYQRPVESTVAVDPSSQLELRNPLCNLPLLREIAEASTGLLVPPTGLKAALQQIDLEPEILESTTKMPLWNRWDLFWIFIVCLSLEWAGRKFIGLT